MAEEATVYQLQSQHEHRLSDANIQKNHQTKNDRKEGH